MLRRLIRVTVLIAVNAVVLLAVLELAGLAYFAVHDGKLFYRARTQIARNRAPELAGTPNHSVPAAQDHQPKAITPQIKYRLNPYYGFQYLANTRVPVEAFGVASAEEAKNCKYQVNVLCENGDAYFVTNNFGFDSVFDYPYRKRRDDEFVIGSSASWSLSAS